ncbi:MAG: hypothetical protein V4722_24805 [Bacteroidota bacterium]
MQKIIAIIVCWCWFFQASAQPNITAAEYFVDTDPGIGLATSIPITVPAPTITDKAFSISLTGVLEGVHAFFIRSRDANGKWSVTNRFVFYKPSANAGAPATNIVKAEYFFNNDPGFGNATNIPLAAGVDVPNIVFSAGIDTLPVGVHQLFIRTRNADGRWSITNRQVLYKPSGSAALPAGNIVKAEYFFDNDPGFGSATNIPVTPGVDLVNVNFTAGIDTLPIGVHQLFIRSKNADGRWSVSNRQILYKPGGGAGAPATNIVKAEYFFNNDPGFGNAVNIPVTPGVDVQNILFTAAIDTLPVGVHQLFIRSRNADGRWSVTNRQILYKPNGNSALPPVNIVKAEYFFNNDPGFGNAINIPLTPGTDLANISFGAQLDTLEVGVHSFFIRSLNADGRWSVTNRRIMYKPNPASGLPPGNITNIEYFIDTDPGIGNAVPIAVNPAPNFVDFISPINISGLSVGDHKLYIRSRSGTGWSITNVYTFPIAATATAPFINVNAITKKVMCARDSVNISYDARGTYNGGNVFNVELSDATGSFAAPVIIGSYAGINSSIIACKLPNTLTGGGGTNFRFRVSSTNPVVTGLSGSDALTIGNRSLPQTINGPVQVNGTMNYGYNVPAVANSTWNWMITAGTQQSGGNTSSIGVTWSQPPSPSTTGSIRLVEINYGCAGDTSLLTATIYKLRIGVSTAATACKAFGITVNANADGAFTAGNTITAQLSNASGSFASPVSIGSVPLVGNGLNQPTVINATIPAGIPNGINYRIRLMSSTGSFIGDTSAAISIIKPDMGADLNRVYCIGRGYNLLPNFTDGSLTYAFYNQSFVILARPDSVEAGTYQVIGTNAQGCKDTAAVILTSNPTPNLGADTTVYHLCPGETSNLNPLYNTTGLTAVWNTGNPAAAVPGTYRLVVTNAFGCTDTAFAAVVLEVARWTGALSSNWHTPGNWNIGKVPTDKTHVIVPGGTPNNCIISSANAEAASIQVRNGATLQTINNRIADVKGKCLTLPPN